MLFAEPSSLFHRLHLRLPAFGWLRRTRPGTPSLRVAMSLPRGGCRALPVDREVEVVCHQGELWITRDGDRKDVVLRPSESVRLDRRGRVLFHAMQAAGFELRFAV